MCGGVGSAPRRVARGAGEGGAAPTELVIEDLTPGTGATATVSLTVVADYIGVSCSTGTIFDSSYASGQPATFRRSNVSAGSRPPGTKVGHPDIPAELAFGSTPPPGSVIAPAEPAFVDELRRR